MTEWHWMLYIVRKYSVSDYAPDWEPEDEEVAESFAGKSKEEAIKLGKAWISSHDIELEADHELVVLEYAPSDTKQAQAESVNEEKENIEILWPHRYQSV